MRRRTTMRWIAGGIALGLVGLLVAASGVVPIKASSGHWPITGWFLHFAMRRSVATHALGTEVPPLDDPALVLRGAGHFETGCRPCHGAPGSRPPRIPGGLSRRPPRLATMVPELSPAESFYIVKHGIKFTGMPAWPVEQRDDEVWAVVAFLQLLPGLDEEGYRELVFGPRSQPRPVAGNLLLPAAEGVPGVAAALCARCHGDDGGGRGLGAFPRLAGQRREYLRRALRAYAEGRRSSGIMGPIAAALDEPTMEEVAAAYAAMVPAQAPPSAADPDLLARGAAIAARGVPARRVPSCVDCHGPRTGPVDPAYPRLAGQYAAYLELQLRLFKEGRRGGAVSSHLMHEVVDTMSEEQMRQVAAYYASLPAAR